MNNQQIEVYSHWEGIVSPKLMGILTATKVRGKEVFSFEYTADWLRSKHAQVLDPDLQLYGGPQYLRDEKNNFGMFMDSAPDRWGRLLMRRREAAYARIEGRKEKRLFESDYLLGVFDGHRMGGIRFKTSESDEFLNNDQAFATPPWTSLGELEYASLQLEREDAVDDPSYLQWLSLLVAPGSSLGGARPKASILDKNEHLWIAKFPSKNDEIDIGAWEMLVHELGKRAGLLFPDAMIQQFSSKHRTFLSKRFDRTDQGTRIHFASAMTLLGYTDGVDYQDGISYLEMVEFLMQYGAAVESDLHELWKRIVFSICVNNTDDHLRNHGFLLTPEGWRLSPAYDINPNPTGYGLSLNISENDNSLDYDLALSVAEYFRLPLKQAKEIIKEMQATIHKWPELAKQYNLSRSEQELMAAAFL